jgi:hypothetical protein
VLLVAGGWCAGEDRLNGPAPGPTFATSIRKWSKPIALRLLAIAKPLHLERQVDVHDA